MERHWTIKRMPKTPTPVEYDDLTMFHINVEYSFLAMPGILFAGLIYPPVMLIVSMLFVVEPLEQMIFNGFGVVVLMLAWGIVMLVVSCMTGFFVALLAGAVSNLFANICNFVFRSYFDTRTIVGIAGGLTGFVPLAFPVLYGLPGSAYIFATYVILGPTLAMLTGTVFAMSYFERHFHEEITWLTEQHRDSRMQFSIYHVLVLTAAVSVALAISRSLDEAFIALAIVYWTCIQTITIWWVRKWICRPNGQDRELSVTPSNDSPG